MLKMDSIFSDDQSTVLTRMQYWIFSTCIISESQFNANDKTKALVMIWEHSLPVDFERYIGIHLPGSNQKLG